MATFAAVGIIQCNFYSFTAWVSTLKVPQVQGFPVELSDQEHKERTMSSGVMSSGWGVAARWDTPTFLSQ